MSTIYTAISFAPVQGFIERSRKLRDLYGASLILAYLSQQLAQAANQKLDCDVISPALINVQEGMPNRLLIAGDFSRNDANNAILNAWEKVLTTCQAWLETNLSFLSDQYCWQHEWEKWQQYTWEVFWGQGDSTETAMADLEQRKFKRDWVGINWIGESSSLTGTDAIAWHRLGQFDSDPGRSLSPSESKEMTRFYRELAWILDNPARNKSDNVPDQDAQIEGKYIALNERLSIPELTKRLITYSPIAQKIGMTELDQGFAEINRDNWTGWFMGDGDQVGAALKSIGHDTKKQQAFSQAMRQWGQKFKDEFSQDLGRVIYAGGDDFLGVIHSDRLDAKTLSSKALSWLQEFKKEWEKHNQPINVSMGFVWAAKRIPQRDILQHCREVEKLAKSKGRDRVAIRVVFRSGQYVQWVCPWDNLVILTRYRDREGGTNWTHLYKDWAYLKARHAVRFTSSVDRSIAEAMLNIYFEGWQQDIPKLSKVVGGEKPQDVDIVSWMDDLVQVGWQLCSNI